MRGRLASSAAFLAALALLLVACGRLGAPPLGRVQATPPQPSPDQRDQTNRLDLHYHLNAPATVSAWIQSSSGQSWSLYDNVSRPTAGDYVLRLDGTVPGPGPNERRALPDGDYQVTLDVTDGSQHQAQAVPMSIRGASTSVPDITNLALQPDHISPNFDAINDATHVTYQLAKTANVSLYLDRPASDGSQQRIWSSDETQVQAGAQNVTFDGLINGAPLPKGTYTLGVRARDAAGNVVERGQTLVVDDSGVPDATLVGVRIGPLQIIRGNEVCLDAVVRNTGETVLRTEGPDPGYVYDAGDSFSSIANHQYQEQAGLWRVGLTASGGTDPTGATYPYRWGFGKDLQPGDEATVHGCVKATVSQDKLVFFAGLIQENVAIHNAGAGMVRVDISS